ncbi:MAG: DUF1631 domain-containing protein [Pseudomonas sp.]
MSKDQKVVSLASVGGGGQRAKPMAHGPLHAPLAAVRDRALTYLRVGLSELFDNADDTLFEKADRAGSNADQSMFFDAMRLLRLQRHAVEKSCCVGLDKQFNQLQHGQSAERHAASAFDLDSLSLVQPDELEQTVALDSMVGRVVARNQIALMHLTLRLNNLVSSTVTDANNALAPAQLVQLFADSCAPLNLDIKVRLIVLKMFERHVFNSIDSLYADINELLANAGILPDLRQTAAAQRPRPLTQPTSNGQRATTAGSQENTDQQVLSLFSELMSSWRHTSGDIALSALGAPSAAPVRSDELLGMLSHFTNQAAHQGATLADLRGHISQQLNDQQRQTGELRKLDRVDDDVINLVSMLFDVILGDSELPAALKALIGRMQLPILRVAIADKSLFNRASHPARRLLNELARATMGWSDHDDLQRDQLHALLERMVDRMLGEELIDAAFFEQMHEELAGFVRLEQRRAERLEQRTRDAEEGRARVEAARSKSAKVLNGLLMGRTLPVFAVDLLRDRWSQVLQLAFLREGEQSSAWQHAVLTAGQLIDSIEVPSSDAIEQRRQLNDDVGMALCDGLRLLGEEQPGESPLLQQLRSLQSAALAAAVTTQAPAEIELEVPDSEEGTSEPLISDEPVEMYAPAPPPPAAHEIPILMDMVLVEEPVLAEPDVEQSAQTIEDLPNGDAAGWVDNLHAGSWFELTVIEDKPAQRCKLAAIISFSGKYIFVNRTGMKVAEFNRLELSKHYEAGAIRLLANDQLFDRALESVIGNLRQLRDKRP